MRCNFEIHGVVLQKVCGVNRLNQKALIKTYIDMNTELRKIIKMTLEKYISKQMNNSVFGKTRKQ